MRVKRKTSAHIFIFYTVLKSIILVFRQANPVPEILGQTDPVPENADFQSIFARSALAVTASEKSNSSE